MTELIKNLTETLGISQGDAGNAVGGILQMIQGQADSSDFSALLGKLPGAQELLDQASGGSGSGGLLGGALKGIGSALGGGAGSALNLAGIFQGANLDGEKGGQLVSMVVSFLKDKVGSDLLTKVLGNVPDLLKLVK